MKPYQLKTAIIMFLFYCSATVLYAQPTGIITGTVRDAQTHQPIAGATVLLINYKTKASINTAQAGTNGVLVINGVPFGTYTLHISCIGYTPVVNDSITVNAANSSVAIGDVNLRLAQGNILNNVTVVAKTPVLKNGTDKKVFLVNQSLVSVGGSAADLLQNVPTLQIDVNGNVSLRGAGNVKVLVDGRPSIIDGGNVAQILQSIPAGSIEKVEVITNPSAKYSAEGQGIINIILKKNSKPGFNGLAAVTTGTRGNYNINTGISYKSNTINLYGNYTYQRTNTYSNGFQNMAYLLPGNPFYFSNENFPSTTINKINIANAGMDYRVTSKSTISLAGTYNNRNTNRSEYLTVDNLSTSHLPVQLSNRYNTTNGQADSYDASLDFTQAFNKPKEALTFNVSYAHSVSNSGQVYSTDIYNINGQPVKPPAAIQQYSKQGNNNAYNIQLDYTLPFGKTATIETGYRSQVVLTRNNQWDYNYNNATGQYDPDDSLINFFKSTGQVHAAYINYSKQIKKFTFQIGLRGEIGKLKAGLQSLDTSGGLANMPIEINTKGLYPSVFLTQRFNNGQQLQLSYTRRINRPTPKEINPFLDVSDPVNYDTGNPNLLPEDIHAFELTYNKTWQKVTLTSSLYFNEVNNVIKHIQATPINGVTITIPENLRRSSIGGVEVISNVNLMHGWDFTANVNVYNRVNSANPQYGITATDGVSWNANITNNVTITKGLYLQLRADYRASDVIIQDRNRAAYGIDAGAKYDLPNKKATLSFTARDILNTRRWAFLRVSDALLLDFERITYSARASLTFTWHFGNGTEAVKKQPKASEQPAKRIDGN